MSSEISPTFRADDARACDALDRLKGDLKQARTLSPSIVVSLAGEIETREAALGEARDAAREHDRESHELARAVVQRQAALVAINTSHEVDPEAAAKIVQAAALAQYTEAAYRRRADAAESKARSGYGRCAKDIQDRNAAVSLAETIAGAVVDHEQHRIPDEKRPAVLAWLRVVAPVEGAASYERSYANRIDSPSHPIPPEPAEYVAAIARVYAAADRAREQAAKLARELEAVTQ
jgi:hypothetical protein